MHLSWALWEIFITTRGTVESPWFSVQGNTTPATAATETHLVILIPHLRHMNNVGCSPFWELRLAQQNIKARVVSSQWESYVIYSKLTGYSTSIPVSSGKIPIAPRRCGLNLQWLPINNHLLLESQAATGWLKSPDLRENSWSAKHTPFLHHGSLVKTRLFLMKRTIRNRTSEDHLNSEIKRSLSTEHFAVFIFQFFQLFNAPPESMEHKFPSVIMLSTLALLFNCTVRKFFV